MRRVLIVSAAALSLAGCGSTQVMRTASGAAIVVPPDEPLALASGMATLAQDAAMRQRLGESGRAFATSDKQPASCARSHWMASGCRPNA